MAGAAFQFHVEGLAPAERRLKVLHDRVGDLTPLMDIIGMVLEVDAQDNFEGEHAPDGTPWLPSVRAKETGGKTLQDTRRLYQSITHRATSTTAEVGTNVAYAARHQEGFSGTEKVASHKRTMRQFFGLPLAEPIEVIVGAFDRKANTPARPFLGASTNALEEIEGHVADYVDAED